MLADPDNAMQDLTTINELLCTLHRECRGMLPAGQLQPVLPWERIQPPGFGQLCGCTCQLIDRRVWTPLGDFIRRRERLAIQARTAKPVSLTNIQTEQRRLRYRRRRCHYEKNS